MSILSFLKSIIQSILQSLGLSNKKGTILLLGLDNAGKTTLLHKLRTNTISSTSTPPTDRPHSETFYMGNIQFVGWDLGGHEAVRHIWDDYIMRDNINAILFMIDVSDWKRFDEVRDELDALINDEDKGLKRSGVPLAILLNKCDLEDAQSSSVVADCIGYSEIMDQYNNYSHHDNLDFDDYGDGEDDESDYYNDKRIKSKDYENREMVKMFRISVWKGEGYAVAFQWIASFL